MRFGQPRSRDGGDVALIRPWMNFIPMQYSPFNIIGTAHSKLAVPFIHRAN
jgi:hypothetical protein